ncbi:MAG: transglutaminase domain-containing protein [Clostridiales bacterium]|nr:transglutaminase domain-containing protein [Clostridiales bacterium]
MNKNNFSSAGYTVRRIKTAPALPLAPERQRLSSSEAGDAARALLGYLLRAAVAFVASFALIMFIRDAFDLDKLGSPLPEGATALAQYMYELSGGLESGVTGLFVLLLSFAFTFFFAFMAYNKTTAAIGVGVMGVGAGIYFAAVKSPIAVLRNSFYCLWNAVMGRLLNAGYRAADLIRYDNVISEGYEVGDGTLMRTAVALLIMIYCAVFVFSLVKKTRLLPAFILGLATVIGVFTYNVASNNWYFALILAAMCGMLALKLYDRHYVSVGLPDKKDKKEKKEKKSSETVELDAVSSDAADTLTAEDKEEKKKKLKKQLRRRRRRYALGGYAGAACMALVFLMIALPAASIKGRWAYYEKISQRLSYFDAVASSFIIGETPNQGDLGYLGNLDTLNARDVDAESHHFTGREMLNIETSYPYPLYLRSWVGTYFQKDIWYSATTDDVARYKSRFGNDFVPEQVMKSFYDIVAPNSTRVNSLTSHYDRIKDGFVTVSVDMRNVSSSGNLLFIPSYMNPDFGLMRRGESDTEAPTGYEEEYKNYYEGIYTTGWLNINKEYRVSAFLPSYRSPTYAKTLREQLDAYKKAVYMIKMAESGTDPEIIQMLDSLELVEDNTMTGILEPEPIPKPDAAARAFESYLALSESEKKEFVRKNIDIPADYEDFVRSTYLGKVENKAVIDACYKVIANLKEEYPEEMAEVEVEPGVYDRGILYQVLPYETVRAVIDYLSENNTYTLSPAVPKNRAKDAVSIFLEDTHEGYCVQFATTSALMLRVLGFPTRYCEGYIVTDFERNDMSSAAAESNKKKGIVNRYSASIRDWDAHAWIECYISGRGWMQFETTPQYYDSMYKPYEATSSYTSHSTPRQYDLEPLSEEPDDGVVIVRKTEYGGVIIGLAIFVAAIVALILFIRRLKRKADDNDFRRTHDITNTRQEELEEEEIHRLALNLAEDIFDACAAAGIVPKKGELPTEFAVRAQTELEEFTAKRRAREDLVTRLALSESEGIKLPDVMPIIEAARFGGKVSLEQLRLCADYYRALRVRVTESLSLPERFVAKHIKLMI